MASKNSGVASLRPCSQLMQRLLAPMNSVSTFQSLSKSSPLIFFACGSVKAKIEEREGVPPDQQTLGFGGKRLENHLTIQECGILEDSVLMLVFTLPK